MKLTQYLRSQLDREVERSRRVLANAPAGKYQWKPHEKSMIFGNLADMVATMPSWIAMIVAQETGAALVAALDEAAAGARAALEKTSDEHLQTQWRLLARGQVVSEAPRHEMIQDTLGHWAHHRGQLTVYLRLLGAPVPSVYGPTADDPAFR